MLAADTLTPLNQAQTKLGGVETSSLKDVVNLLTDRELRAISNFLDSRGDPRTKDGNRVALSEDEVKRSGITGNAKTFLSQFGEFSRLYYGRFPDITETESLQTLFEYISDKEYNWSIFQIRQNGKLVGFSTGATIGDLNGYNLSWNEHIATEKSLENKGIGKASFDARNNGLKTAIAVSEFEDPAKLLNPKDHPKAFDHSDPKARSAYWRQEGYETDPFTRLDIHEKRGYTVACVMGKEGKLSPLPYTQISMDVEGLVAGCETLMLAVGIEDPKLLRAVQKGLDKAELPSGVNKDDIAGVLSLKGAKTIISTMAGALSEDHALYPEYERLRKALNQCSGAVYLVKSGSETLRDVCSRPVEEASLTQIEDLQFVRNKLTALKKAEKRDGQLTEEQRAQRQMLRQIAMRLVLELKDSGLTSSEIALQSGVARRKIESWMTAGGRVRG